MVCIKSNPYQNLIFEHFVDMPSVHCCIASARNPQTNRIELFLIEQDTKSVYHRDGRVGCWHHENQKWRHDEVLLAYIDRSIPHFTTKNPIPELPIGI